MAMLALLLPAAVQAQSPSAPNAPSAAPAPEPSSIRATRLSAGEQPVLDGSLTHPAWQRAVAYRSFVARAPVNGAAPAFETVVRVLYDDAALYVGVDALDPEPGRIRAPMVRHDNVNRTQDFVALYIDAIGARQSAQFFRVNAAGSTADGMHTAADDNEDFSPDFDFDARAALHAGGYSAVFRIPFASLRYTSTPGGPWRIMVVRRVPREQFHMLTSVLIPNEAAHFLVSLQPLQGLQPPIDQSFLSLRPSLTWRQQSEQNGAAPARRSQRFEASLDLKWRPLPELVVDATLRPDFSQVALDVPQLAGNTRYALSLAEKRPFFFEASDLLRSPTDALYSRSFTEPRWGLRGTWRGAQLAGTAFAINDHGGASVLLPGVYATAVAQQPPSQSLVLRARHDQGNWQWGGLVAARQYADGRGSNNVLGPDLAWQFNDDWRVRGQWLLSDTSAWPDGAAGLGGLVRGPAQRGQRAYAKLFYAVDATSAELWADDIGTGFRHDTGFVNQNGVRSLAGHYGHGWRQVGPLNELWFNLNLNQVRDKQTGQTVLREAYPGFWLNGPSNLEWFVDAHLLSQQRTASTAPLLGERYLKTELTVTPAPWMPFLVVGARLGRLADVRANTVRPGGGVNLKLTTRPLAALEFEPSWSQAWLDAGGRHTYRESVAQVLAVWHLGPQQNLRAIWQRSAIDRLAEPANALHAGIAAARGALTTGSLTYALRRSAGTVFYLGASRSRDEAGVGGVGGVGGNTSRGNEFFIKLQADVDELRRSR